MREQQRVAIVGAGFSGAALAAQLLAHECDHVHVTLIEASGRFGRGVAYGTHCAEHLLNTRADRMSLLAEDPEHFVRWCRGRGLAIGHADFAPRRIYGDYVERPSAHENSRSSSFGGDAFLYVRIWVNGSSNAFGSR